MGIDVTKTSSSEKRNCGIDVMSYPGPEILAKKRIKEV
jgi:hypothetical protein